MGIELTQAEADALLAMKKQPTESAGIRFPVPGGRLTIQLQSLDQTEDFLLDVSRSRIDFVKIGYQHRGRAVVVLMRLDIGGAPHRNPDGVLIPCPHLHLYREEFGDKWAYPIPAGKFQHLDNQATDADRFYERVQRSCASNDSAEALLMLHEVQKLLDEYTAWLKNNQQLREIGEWVEITTPYVDRHNDLLQIYARRESDHFILTDDGYTIQDLASSGCVLTSAKRQQLLKMTLNGFGVKLHGNEMQVAVTPESFPQRKHNLIQAMLAVNDMFYLAEPMVKNLFHEDVVAWLDANDIRYTPNLKLAGTSGYDHRFDFVIPKSRNAPERILRAINRPGRDSAEAYLHAWTDTQQKRASESVAYAILNDIGQPVPLEVSEAFRAYEVRPVFWSRREEVRDQLAA